MPETPTQLTQYLAEAHAMEAGLVRVLQSQILITPRGPYRTVLERHLEETEDHRQRLRERLREVAGGNGPIQALLGMTVAIVETVAAQSLAFAKTPVDLLRGSNNAEKVLKNAKDACATEALEIATYIALERVARLAGDDLTGDLAASIRTDEEAMLDQVTRMLPRLTDDAVKGVFDASTTGAADAARTVSGAAKQQARKAGGAAKRQARKASGAAKQQARKASDTAKAAAGEAGDAAKAAADEAGDAARRVPGAARVEGTAKGVVASADDLPIKGYADLNADDVVKALPPLTQVELAEVEAFERRSGDRTTVLDRIETLRGDEPWNGYDEQTVAEIRGALGNAPDKAREVREYEQAHKQRAGVLRLVSS